jgi:hypothetical protein
MDPASLMALISARTLIGFRENKIPLEETHKAANLSKLTTKKVILRVS